MNDETLEILEGYVANLQAGACPERDAILARNPALAGHLECLDVLDQLAPAKSAGSAADQTLLYSDGTDLGPARDLPFIGAEFGAYVVECEIGRGGMGVVFKAHQKGLDRTVALKMILSSQLASADQVSRFQDEARAAARLHHPNIVAIYEAGQLNGQPFFAMQYIAGPSLAQRLRAGPLPAETAARIVLAIAHAVEHLHRNNVVHRDLKPSNILLDELGNPFVTDFGLVKMLAGESHRTQTGVIVGTPSYMSPEQASGHAGKVGPLSDVYSLGAILYELLTGRPPYQEETPLDTLVQVLEGEPVAPRKLNPCIARDLETICLRCLEKLPADRYAGAAALASDLEKHLKNEEIDTRPPGLIQRARRWARREPALVSRLITLSVCIVLAQISYQAFRTVDLSLHVRVMGILTFWGAASLVCQRLLYLEPWAETIRYAWSALDVVLYSAILYVDDGLVSPIIIGYPLLVAASGLWFRERFVWFTTLIAELSYAALLIELYLRTETITGLHKHIIFLVALAVLAATIAYQVNRVRALSRYYEHRPLP